jgi:hypothetical protein
MLESTFAVVAFEMAGVPAAANVTVLVLRGFATRPVL